MKDLHDSRLIWLKGVLFLMIGLTSATLLWMDSPTLKTGLLVTLTIWASCRAYYFAFYVLERYLDPGFRFSGLGSIVLYLVRRQKL